MKKSEGVRIELHYTRNKTSEKSNAAFWGINSKKYIQESKNIFNCPELFFRRSTTRRVNGSATLASTSTGR